MTSADNKPSARELQILHGLEAIASRAAALGYGRAQIDAICSGTLKGILAWERRRKAARDRAAGAGRSRG